MATQRQEKAQTQKRHANWQQERVHYFERERKTMQATKIFYLEQHQCLYVERISDNLHTIYLLDDVYFDGELWYPRSRILVVSTDELTFEYSNKGMSWLEFQMLLPGNVVHYQIYNDNSSRAKATVLSYPSISVWITLNEAYKFDKCRHFAKGERILAGRNELRRA